MEIMLPSGELVPEHFHITEVGRVQKDFIDCGGTVRRTAACVLQVWTANDFDHRLVAGKLAKVIDKARASINFLDSDLKVDLEYGADEAVQYHLSDVEITGGGLMFVLSGRQTDCLAKDKCGVSGCC